MPDITRLNDLINVAAHADSPRLLIYSDRISNRFTCVCDFIFNRVLGVKHELTTDFTAFKNSASFRINYSDETVTSTVQIIPNSLLFETEIRAEKPAPVVRNGKVYFFQTSDREFDVFSAVFYFISRYEEWQEFKKDAHGRFEAAESLLYKNNVHLQPVVDQWIMELKEQLMGAYPELIFPPLKFNVISTLDVDNLFAYKNKGAVRTIGASLKDLAKGDLKNFVMRIRVLRGRIPDPFDVYEEVSAFCRNHNVPLCYFFLFRSGTTFDRTVDPASGAFEKVFETLKKNGASLGLHPSYHSPEEPAQLSSEVKQFSLRSGGATRLSRQHYLRFDIRRTPSLLMENGITTDFTMGFASSPGFRAGTAYPFTWYDFAQEKSTALLFVPFCAMDGAYFIYKQHTPEEAMTSLLNLAAEIKKTGGNFVTVFHERTFSNHLYPGFATLYKNLQLALKESDR